MLTSFSTYCFFYGFWKFSDKLTNNKSVICRTILFWPTISLPKKSLCLTIVSVKRMQKWSFKGNNSHNESFDWRFSHCLLILNRFLFETGLLSWLIFLSSIILSLKNVKKDKTHHSKPKTLIGDNWCIKSCGLFTTSWFNYISNSFALSLLLLTTRLVFNDPTWLPMRVLHGWYYWLHDWLYDYTIECFLSSLWRGRYS